MRNAWELRRLWGLIWIGFRFRLRELECYNLLLFHFKLDLMEMGMGMVNSGKRSRWLFLKEKKKLKKSLRSRFCLERIQRFVFFFLSALFLSPLIWVYVYDGSLARRSSRLPFSSIRRRKRSRRTRPSSREIQKRNQIRSSSRRTPRPKW